MREIILFLITFMIIIAIYLLFVVYNKRSLKKIYNGTEARYLKARYKIDLNQLEPRKFAWHIALINAFIIAFTLSLVLMLGNYLLMIVGALLLVLCLIIVLYHLLGSYYQKKLGVDKNV
ncbi:MAG: hypothetical protein V8Q75_04260 [Bacilli bacterium]